MLYIHKVIGYIKRNCCQIDPANHRLDLKFNVSLSKLDKDFYEATGTTVQRFIKCEKILSARDELLENPKSNISDILSKVGWDCDITFRTNFKDLTGYSASEMKNMDNDMDIKPINYRDVFFIEEILLRYFLAIKQDTSLEKHHKHAKILIVNVESTTLHFSWLMQLKTITFLIYYDISSNQISTKTCYQHEFDECFCYTPQSMDEYYNLISQLDKLTMKNFDSRASDSIKNWRSILDNNANDNDLTIMIEKNINSEFMLLSEPYLNELKATFKNEQEDYMFKEYAITMETILTLCQMIKCKSYDRIEMVVETILNVPNRDKNVELLLNLIEAPYIDDLFNNDSITAIKPKNIKKISAKSTVQIIEIIKKTEQLKEAFEEDDDIIFGNYGIEHMVASVLSYPS